jgi:hypothetical protein
MTVAGTEVAVSKGPPYVHTLGATHRPAFTVVRLLPAWEPPVQRFGTYVTPTRPMPVRSDRQEIPEAFRRACPPPRAPSA